MSTCPSCGGRIDDGATRCPHCGATPAEAASAPASTTQPAVPAVPSTGAASGSAAAAAGRPASRGHKATLMGIPQGDAPPSATGATGATNATPTKQPAPPPAAPTSQPAPTSASTKPAAPAPQDTAPTPRVSPATLVGVPQLEDVPPSTDTVQTPRVEITPPSTTAVPGKPTAAAPSAPPPSAPSPTAAPSSALPAIPPATSAATTSPAASEARAAADPPAARPLAKVALAKTTSGVTAKAPPKGAKPEAAAPTQPAAITPSKPTRAESTIPLDLGDKDVVVAVEQLNQKAAAKPTKATSPTPPPSSAPPATPSADRRAGDEVEADVTEDTHNELFVPIGPKATASAPAAPPPSPSRVEPPVEPTVDATGETSISLVPLPVMSSGPVHVRPLPPPPSSSLWAQLRYLPALGRALLERQKAERALRERLVEEQRALDAELRGVGKAARAEKLALTNADDALAAAEAADERQRKAGETIAGLDGRRAEEEARWKATEAGPQEELAKRRDEVRRLEELHATKLAERRALADELAALESKVKDAQRRAGQADARAARAAITDAAQGGGAGVASAAKAESEAALAEATALLPERESLAARLAALDGHVAALARSRDDEKAAIDQTRKELAEGLLAHKKVLDGIDAEHKRAEADRASARSDLDARHVALGALVVLQRDAVPQLASRLARVDEAKALVTATEAELLRVTSGQHAWDRVAVRNGLAVVGGAVLVLLILAVVLIKLL